MAKRTKKQAFKRFEKKAKSLKRGQFLLVIRGKEFYYAER